MDKLITPTVFLQFLFPISILVFLALVAHSSRQKKWNHTPLSTTRPASVEHQLDPSGTIMVNGELWRAQSATGETITFRQNVRVVGASGPLLLVKVVHDPKTPSVSPYN